MRCIACNKIIKDYFIKISKQDEYCEECYTEIQKVLNPVTSYYIETVSYDTVKDTFRNKK